jgi:hypothetical protein
MLSILGCLLPMFPLVYPGIIQQSVKLANLARQLYQNTTGSLLVMGRSIVIDQPKNFEPGETKIVHDHDPSNLTGEWRITNTILGTSPTRYRNLRSDFRIFIQQNGHDFQGVGEKQTENGNQIPISTGALLKIYGTIKNGSGISGVFREENRSQSINGSFSLTIHDRNQLTGTFASTSAKIRGSSQWIRTSSRQGQHVNVSAQQSQEVAVGPPPAPPPEQSTPTVIIPWWWSWLLTVCGVVGLMLAGSQVRVGWLIGFVGQVLWIAYALYTQQWGFLVSAVAFGTIYAWNWSRGSFRPRRLPTSGVPDTQVRAAASRAHAR